MYKFLRKTVDYLKRVTNLHGADPTFRAHNEEIESRIEAMRGGEHTSLLFDEEKMPLWKVIFLDPAKRIDYN